jgi:GcrA cell cycle regulator
MRAVDPWSRERVALLKKLWAEGATAQSIADRLGGVSRAAVMGKIFRLRLDAGTPSPAAALRASKLSERKVPADARAPLRRRRDVTRDAGPPAQSPAPTRGKSLFELSNDSCRWPYGRPGSARFHFCGAPEADLEGGVPYCPQHAARAYVKHPGLSKNPNAVAAEAPDGPARPAGQRRYTWHALVRHPAVRWR